MSYNVIKGYKKTDNTMLLKEQEAEFVEYVVNPLPLETFKDARAFLVGVATREGMTVFNNDMNAEKVVEKEDPETWITTVETETLRIVRV